VKHGFQVDSPASEPQTSLRQVTLYSVKHLRVFWEIGDG